MPFARGDCYFGVCRGKADVHQDGCFATALMLSPPKTASTRPDSTRVSSTSAAEGPTCGRSLRRIPPASPFIQPVNLRHQISVSTSAGRGMKCEWFTKSRRLTVLRARLRLCRIRYCV